MSLVGKTLLERYNVQESLGRGGMAEVYKVWDSHRMTYLAMKVILEDLAVDKVFMRRFKREADTLAKLQHPNIVRFYGLERDGRLAFMLLDYIEGDNLKPIIFDAGGPLPQDKVRSILRSVCGALSYAHRQGMVHCDIKSANIMLNKLGDAMLTDFGIARMTDAATATMVGVGTPAYMAPEQVRGENPTPQSDIYSLGVVLFEMLTGGERPFTGEQATSTGSTSEKVRWEQMNMQPPSLRKWNPNIPPELEAVVMKCLAKESGERFQSALEVVNAFESAVSHEDTPKEKSAPIQPATLPPPSQHSAPPPPVQQIVEVQEPVKEFVKEKPRHSPPVRTPSKPRKIFTWPFIVGGILFIASIGWAVSSGSTLTTPFSSKTSQRATKTIIPSQVKIVEVPNTNTPAPPTKTLIPPTPTIAPPIIILDYLDDVVVSQTDNFDSSKGWDLWAGKISNGVLEIQGKDWNGLGRKGSFPEGTGIVINFKYEKGSEFEMYYDYGEWQTDAYRRFGIYYWSAYPKANLWLGKRGLGFNSLHGNLKSNSETWYTLLMVTDADGEFLAVIWDPENPGRTAIYHEKNEKWAGYKWNLRIGANKGAIVFDDFMKISFSGIR